jgi:prepilin-type N-terminal cleavage/methylation domain-containing protein
MSSFKRKREEGFTIIEIMIVLAIAGLIMLIVFLAVPALQRTARNTTRKDDAAAIGAAISNFISDNNGTMPTELSTSSAGNGLQLSTPATSYIGGGSYTGYNIEVAKLGFYTLTTPLNLENAATKDGNVYIDGPVTTPVTVEIVATGGAVNAATISTDTITIIIGQDCTNTLSSRTAAIWYATETGSGNGTLQCLED